MNSNALEVEGVTKTFHLKTKRIFNSKQNFKKVKALQDVTFSVKKGETFGIIGFNGSGKTTLLRILAGIYTPDSGSVHIYGKLAPLLQIGLGFNNDFDARENIEINGRLLGMSKTEIRSKINDILEFAELEKFSAMDLKHFSSGMRTRLAVSTALKINSDIILLDEVLSTGDAIFAEKCLDAFHDFIKSKKTILLTGHNLRSLSKFCNRILFLDKGKVITIGEPDEVLPKFSKLVKLRRKNKKKI